MLFSNSRSAHGNDFVHVERTSGRPRNARARHQLLMLTEKSPTGTLLLISDPGNLFFHYFFLSFISLQCDNSPGRLSTVGRCDNACPLLSCSVRAARECSTYGLLHLSTQQCCQGFPRLGYGPYLVSVAARSATPCQLRHFASRPYLRIQTGIKLVNGTHDADKRYATVLRSFMLAPAGLVLQSQEEMLMDSTQEEHMCSVPTFGMSSKTRGSLGARVRRMSITSGSGMQQYAKLQIDVFEGRNKASRQLPSLAKCARS